MKRLLLFLLLFASQLVHAQLVAGPMLGPVELRDAVIWLEVGPRTKQVELSWVDDAAVRSMPVKGSLAGPTSGVVKAAVAEERTVQLQLSDLQPGHSYQYSIRLDGKEAATGRFHTKALWQWRQPAPDFTFITGSCAYFNEPVYDRPGKPYGGDSSIFLTMAKENAAFNLWLGDNWYYREVDFFSASGLRYRARRDRAQPVLQPLLKAMPQIAIWDDHDFGPNDGDKSFVLKEESRKIFRSYWPNHSYGENGNGIYTKFSWSDVDIFMMDDRWFRSANNIPHTDSAKRMWGAQQMEWLKNALASSNATFKIIATGNQTLNKMARAECLQDYPVEFNELQDFLVRQGVDGVLFFTGDRHHSEVVRWDRAGTYPLFDVTSSPLTSGISRVTATPEEANPQRLAGTLVEAQNFTRVSVTGARGARRLQVAFVGIDGKTLGSWSVNESELKTARTR